MIFNFCSSIHFFCLGITEVLISSLLVLLELLHFEVLYICYAVSWFSHDLFIIFLIKNILLYQNNSFSVKT